MDRQLGKRKDEGVKKFLWWAAMNGGFAAAVWFGFIEGVDGAQYLAKFWVWAVALPLGLVALTDEMQKRLGAEPSENALRRAVAHAIAWAALGVFVWHGHVATAAAWGFWMVAGYVAREGAQKHRALASSAPSA